MDNMDKRDLWDHLNAIESTLSMIYNPHVSPPNGIIVRLEREIANHIKQHSGARDRWFKVWMIITQVVLATILGWIVSMVSKIGAN